MPSGKEREPSHWYCERAGQTWYGSRGLKIGRTRVQRARSAEMTWPQVVPLLWSWCTVRSNSLRRATAWRDGRGRAGLTEMVVALVLEERVAVRRPAAHNLRAGGHERDVADDVVQRPV